MPIKTIDDVHEVVNNIYETIEPIPTYQVSPKGPYLDHLPWHTLAPGEEFVVEGYGTGKDGLSLMICFYRKGKPESAYIRPDELEQKAITIMFASGGLNETQSH